MSHIKSNKLYSELVDKEHFRDILAFTDLVIGQGYYNKTDLEKILLRSATASFVLTDGIKIFGIRFTLPPKTWMGEITKISPDLWQSNPETTAYFKSAFIHPELRGCGFGKKLAEDSISALKQLSTTAIVCHSHVESPNNSSFLYLKSMGFKEVKSWPNFWSDVNYLCVTCGKMPCICTAKEMILHL